jgi:hypothetical protein
MANACLSGPPEHPTTLVVHFLEGHHVHGHKPTPRVPGGDSPRVHLLATTLLILGGAAFGTLLFTEADAADKFDDGSLVAIGVFALVWYLIGDHRFRLTLWPAGLAALAVAVQLASLVIERHDSAAVGDNFGGLILYVPMLIPLVYQLVKDRRAIGSGD